MRVKLKDIADFVNGRAFKSSEWSDQGLPIIRIQNLNDPEKPFNYFEGEYDKKNFIQSGDTLLSWSGTPGTSFGCFKWTREDGLLNQHIFKVQLKTEEVDQDYFVRAVNKNLNVLIDQSHGGVGLKHITKGKLNEVPIYLPPLDQQKKIAAILDAADAYRQKTKALIEKYDELAQSLFLNMFGDPLTNPKGWGITLLSNACSKITDGTHDTPDRLKEGVKFITGKHVRPYVIDYDNSDYVDKDVHEIIFRRCNPELGDVLYTNIGVNLGTAAVNKVKYEFSMKNVALLKPNKDLIIGRYIEYFLNSENMKKKIVWIGSLGGAQQFLSLTLLRRLKINLPPLNLQNQFAERVQAIEAQKAQAQASLAQAEDLFNSFLQRAFKGELV
jgi:type I restriction enzyme S subunit